MLQCPMVTSKGREGIWREAAEIQCNVTAIHPIGASIPSPRITDLLRRFTPPEREESVREDEHKGKRSACPRLLIYKINLRYS